MKKIFSLVATLCLFASSALAGVVKVPGAEYTSIDDLTASGGFAIINKAEGKALYGSNAQNLAYDVYEKAFVDKNSGYKWRLNADAGDGNYYLQLLTPAGADYVCWNNGGVLNSQGEAQGWACSFILGLNGDQKGQDIANGAVYTLAYSAENKGWSIKNVGTGEYQGYNNGPAHSATPNYFQFVALKDSTVEDPVVEDVPVIKSLASIIENGTTFLLNSADKYLYGSDNQNAAWTGDYVTAKATTNKVNQFKLEYITAGGKYLFHAYNEGNEVTIYGATPCYLNSQPAANGVIFIMGKDQDGTDGSSWKLAEVEGGYTIQNVANGAYLTSAGLSAEPAVFKIVADIPVESVALGEDFEMTVGDAAKTLTATVLPENASSKALTWTSSDTNVASVANGVVTAVGAGEANIIATANNGKADTVKVTVKVADTDRTSYIVNPTIDGNADGWTFVAPKGGNGPLKPSKDALEYWGGNASDRNGACFTISQVINTLPAGKYYLAAEMLNSSNGESGDHAPNGNAGLFISNGTTESYIGVTEDGEVLKGYQTQAINVYEGMSVTIGVRGTAYLSARWFVADNFRLTYAGEADPEVAVESVALVSDFELAVDQDSLLVATILPENASNKTLTWTSSNTEVVTVENGLVKAIAGGEATITATSANGKSASVKVTVPTPAEKHLAVKKAKLVHTASACWGKNGNTYNNVDGPTAHYNNDAASDWCGFAFAEFDFSGMNAKSIESATLSWTTVTGGRANNNRNNSVYYLAPGTELGYDTIPTKTLTEQYRFADSRTFIETVVGMNTFSASIEVKDAINAAVAAGKTSVIFMWTNSASGGDLVGKGQEDAPTLDIEYDMAPKMKLTKIQDFEGEGVATWTANMNATCSVGENAGNHYAAANVSGTGNRGALYEASTEAIKTVVNGEKNWSIEWDLALSGGNTANRSQDAFALITTGSAIPSNSPAFTNTLFAIEQDQPTTGVSSTTWYIVNPSATCGAVVVADEDKLATVTLEIGAFYHYAVVYDNGNVTATISSDNNELAKVSYKTSYTIADFRGFAACVGRGAGYAYLDNIAAGAPTYAEVVEDPTFEVIGVAYDTVTVKLATATDGAAIKYTKNGGETLTYADSILVDTVTTIVAWAEKNGEVSNTVNKTIIACVTPAPSLAKAGQTYGADTITIKSGIVGGDTYYTINGGDTLKYADPFITDSTITVVAWNVYEGRPSVTASLAVTAGEVAAPVVALDKVIGATRQITFATATAAANIVYKLDDAAEVVGKAGNDTIIIEKDTKISVLARYTEGEKIFESAKVDTTIAAGTELKLAGVEIATVDYSAQKQAADLKVSTSQLEVLLNPSVEIVWSYGTEEGQSGVAANGDVVKNVPVGATFKAYAKTAGYIDSETASLTVVPSYASTIFSEDYEDGTTGSWTMQIAGMLANTAAADGSHFLHFFQQGQSGGRWAQLTFPEYTSTDYTLSFKWGVAAGNGGSSIFTIFAGATEFIKFESPLDMDQTTGQRITTVYGPDGSKVGQFGFNLKTRFEYVDDKLADVEIAVSESGVVLTVVNNLGQTQVKAKVSDSPAIITKLREDLGRSYGSWRIDDIKIAGRSSAVVAPEFALDHYDVLNPAVAMTDATDKTEIYYRAAATTYSYNDKGEIVAGEYTLPETFTKYEAPVVLTDEASIVQAYAVYDGVVSSDTVLSTVYLRLAEVAAPTVTFASVDTLGVQTFNVKDNTAETITATLFYQAIGAEKADTLKAAIVADSLCGWFNVYAQVGDLKSAPVYRYINGAAAYTEPYFGLVGEAQVALPASAGDFEVAVGATVAGEYPTAMTTVAGVQKIHYAVNDNYSAMVLPFGVTVGANVITNAEGDTLVAGVDYTLSTVHNWTINRVNGSGMNRLVTDGVANVTVREAGSSFSAGAPVLFKALTEKAGTEVILSSDVAEPVAVEAAEASAPESGWRVFGNKQYQTVALEGAAYVLNAAGTKFEKQENPVIAPLQIAILVDAENAAALGNTIDLFAPVVLADCDLTRDMFHEWDSYEANANIVGEGGFEGAWGVAGGTVYGNGSVLGAQYADLTGYACLALTFTEGTPRLLLNRQSNDGSSSDFLQIQDAESPYLYAVQAGVWYVDIAKITAEKGYAHLNVIKGANWNPVNITEAKLLGKYPEVVGIEAIESVASLKDGKFMVNGKLFIVRDGRQYNAEGAVIK